jgi:hypothetical protein
MGINVHGVRALCYARRIGAQFDNTATIARQGLALAKSDMSRVLAAFGYPADEGRLSAILTDAHGYAEGLFAHLGAREVHAFDVSPYEGAGHIHDMNLPIPDRYKEQFSLVFDGGSLEHVFNFPVAIKNCMEMVRVGGHYLSILPANNFFGHGFYQFSPELFFNVFKEENGFEVQDIIAFNDRPDRLWRSARPDAPWYAVRNPAEIRERVTLANRDPVSLIVVARRTARQPIFASTPQQSDYALMWQASAAPADQAPAAAPQRSPAFRAAKAVIPAPLRRALRNLQNRPPKPIAEGFDPRYFEPIDPVSGLRR